MELNYKIQRYEWGKRGQDSVVARLFKGANTNFTIENVPYSELWLGTHVNGPSVLKNGQLLSELFVQHPEYLGEGVRKRFGDELPFLFKVLSVNQALSVQAHPSKKHAEELHKLRPDIYKDPNHKPELAIALTPFEALCGFRPFDQIVYFLKNVPELQRIVENIFEDHKANEDDLVKEAFKAVFIASKEVIREKLKTLMERLKTLSRPEREAQCADLIERLYHQYPDDVGCFMVYFLNYLKLQPFEAIYLGANEPHAYISGDCMECMACSDNVVRAGLTPKYIDVETLCSMLIYKGEKPEEKLFKPVIENEYVQLFKPPVQDFAVIQLRIPTSVDNYAIPRRNSASIFIVIEGKAKSEEILLIPGTAVFLPADTTCTITNISNNLLIYQGLANV